MPRFGMFPAAFGLFDRGSTLKPFEYLAPDTVDEAVAILTDNAPDARLLAGGTDYLVELKHASEVPKVVVDVSGISEFKGIELTDKGLRFGSGVTHTEIMESDLVAEHALAMQEAALTIGAGILQDGGDGLDAVEQFGGLLAAVCLDPRGDDIGAALEPAVCLAEHRVGLADAGCRTQVDAQLPALVAALGRGHMLIIHAGAHRDREAAPQAPRSSAQPVQRQVELQHVHPGLTQEAQGAALGVLGDQPANVVDVQPARRGDPAGLQFGVLRRDVRVQAATAGGDGVGGHRGVGGDRAPTAQPRHRRRCRTVASRRHR